MGNLFSQETDNVIVKVKPYYFTKNDDGYSQDKIKNFKITKNITLKKDDIESYITDAWHKFCNAGDPIKANFIKEKKYNKKPIYFATEYVTFEYPKLS